MNRARDDRAKYQRSKFYVPDDQPAKNPARVKAARAAHRKVQTEGRAVPPWLCDTLNTLWQLRPALDDFHTPSPAFPRLGREPIVLTPERGETLRRLQHLCQAMGIHPVDHLEALLPGAADPIGRLAIYVQDLMMAFLEDGHDLRSDRVQHIRDRALYDLLGERLRAQAAADLEGPGRARVDVARARLARLGVNLLLELLAHPPARLAMLGRCDEVKCEVPFFLDRSTSRTKRVCDKHKASARNRK